MNAMARHYTDLLLVIPDGDHNDGCLDHTHLQHPLPRPRFSIHSHPAF